MTLYPTAAQFAEKQAVSLQERIEGSAASRVFLEFVSTSALFPIMDAIRVIAAEGWLHYLTDPAHYVLFAAALIQAWFLGTTPRNHWSARFMGNMLGFCLYAPIDMVIEGLNFFYLPYHWLFGVFSLIMAIFSGLRAAGKWPMPTTLLLNVSKVALFPAMYFILAEEMTHFSQLTWTAWQSYMSSSGHRFVVYGAFFFGILLGLAEAQRLDYAQFLRGIVQRLKEYSEWSLSANLIANAINDPAALRLQRACKTMLFMDIRGFTAWSEQADPQDAVAMLNRFYNVAEQSISRHHGHKPNFTADEIMTRFAAPQHAFEAALELQHMLRPLLEGYNLAVGIGLHTGEVIEGLMGSDSTRKYDIIGDAVNTAKRLESAAGRGEILMSEATYHSLPPSHRLSQASPRTLQVKGKAATLQAMALTP